MWHVFALQHAKRNALQAELADLGVQTLIFYPVPPHLSDAYRDDVRWPPGTFPIAEALANTTLSLPIGPHLSLTAQVMSFEAVISACSDPTFEP